MRSVEHARAAEQLQAPDQDPLDRLPAATERLLRQTERLAGELGIAPPARLAPSLDGLVGRLVQDLVPLMAAEELGQVPPLHAARMPGQLGPARSVAGRAEGTTSTSGSRPCSTWTWPPTLS